MMGDKKGITCLVYLLLIFGMNLPALAAEYSTVSETNVEHEAVIEADSFAGVEGIVTINQSPGNVNDQANVIIFLAIGDETGDPLSDDPHTRIETAVDSSSDSNNIRAIDSRRSDLIKDNAFSGMTGILSVNQISGNATSQISVISVSLGDSPVLTLSEDDLMSVDTRDNNVAEEVNVTAEDIIEGPAFTGARGILSVSQSSGDLNQNTSLIGISFQTITLH